MTVKLEDAPESPTPRVSDSARLEQAEKLHFDKFPGDANSASREHTLRMSGLDGFPPQP